jgi:biopolymer transport protein TolQ
MTDELSVIELILGASLTVKFVMATLVAASVTSWFMIVQRVIILQRANEELLDFEDRFWSGMDLAQLYREGSDAMEEGVDITGGEALFRAGFKEFSKLSRQPNMDAEAMLEGSRRAMRVALMRESDRLERHLPFLASVGSTSPYVGLFGTVWGIMHSFRGLATSSQATLAAVAPGISEALIATAMGLFAAIPAVLAYNRFAAKADALLNRYESFVDEFLGFVATPELCSEARQQLVRSRRAVAEINVVPYIDVMLVLLGYFYGDSTTAHAGCRGGFAEG